MQYDLTKLHQEFGADTICVRRAALQETLRSALGAADVRLGQRITAFTQTDDAVALQFSGGDTTSADLVIGADGIWSEMRARTLADGAPRYAGYGAWLGLAPSTAKPGAEIAEYYGPNGRFGHAATGEGLDYWFFVENVRAPRQHAGPTDAAPLLAALSRWPSWCRQLVETTAPEAIVYAPFYERAVARNWGAGRVLLSGDAMHPFAPNLGQGACQAIEDAHALGRILTETEAPSEIRARYQSARHQRAAMFAREAKKVGTLAQWNRAPMRWFRSAAYAMMTDHVMRKSLRQQFDRASHQG